MKINEITAGSVGAQAGVFGKALGQALASKIAPTGGNTAGATTASVAPGSRQMVGLNTALQQAPALARTSAEAWTKDLQQFMANHRPPLLAASDIDRNDLEQQAWQFVDALLSRSGYALDQLRKGTKEQEKNAWNELEQDVKSLVAGSQTGKDAAIRTAWVDLARSVIIAQTVLQYMNQSMVNARSGVSPRITYNARGELMINGMPANPNDPEDAAIIAQLQASMQPLVRP